MLLLDEGQVRVDHAHPRSLSHLHLVARNPFPPQASLCKPEMVEESQHV
jgi:hypothetical protein